MKRGPSKRHLRGSAGTFKVKGPMYRQHLDGMRPEKGTTTKGRMHWGAKAQ